ncbi:MAG: HAD family hydrolase [Gammaproteobacteria bacterium]|nr:HAD family hydrolase [Gammaproteobacteria bacterium]
MNQIVKNIAMWSGPRNLSTAMMYCFAQRDDCFVVDEPFYAAYLAETGIQHAMYKEVIEAGEVDPVKVANMCVKKREGERTVFYQKQMTKHMLPGFDLEWIHEVDNVFLIREPARVINSYHAKQEDPELSDIGIKEQVNIFNMVRKKTGQIPVVINSGDILKNPEKMLKALCKAIGIDFQMSMLSWQQGPKVYDGVWAPHWYKSVWQSTGFGTPYKKQVEVPQHLQGLLDEANHYYKQISPFAIKGSSS